MSRNTRFIAGAVFIFVAGFMLGNVFDVSPTVNAQAGKVFELRTYTTPDGLLPNLQARFRDHTMRIFDRHGMHNVGYWVPQDSPASENTLIYIISHDSRQAAADSWASFRDDAEWAEVAQASRVDGQGIVTNVESVFMESTDYSPMK